MTDPSLSRPVIILVEPQLAENVGMTARAMGNFGLDALRIVNPKGGWPMKGVRETASSATHVLDGTAVFPTVPEALADLHYVLATTARERGQMKRVFGPDTGMAEAAGRVARGERVGILFGRERVGLSNDEVSLADAIVTFPVDPEHSSLNLAQSVLLMGYEWRRAAGQAVLPFSGEMRSGPAPREALISLFENLEAELDAAGYYPPAKRDGMIRNMRDMFHRMAMTEQDVKSFRGALRALARRPAEDE